MLVQSFIPEAPVETLDVSVFHWLARPDERQRYTNFISPCVRHLAGELRTVVGRNRDRQATHFGPSLQNLLHAKPEQRGVDFSFGFLQDADGSNVTTRNVSQEIDSIIAPDIPLKIPEDRPNERGYSSIALSHFVNPLTRGMQQLVSRYLNRNGNTPVR